MNMEEEKKAFTYRALLGHLQTLDEEQLDMNVSILAHDMDEYLPAFGFDYTVGSGVLDDNHPVIEID